MPSVHKISLNYNYLYCTCRCKTMFEPPSLVSDYRDSVGVTTSRTQYVVKKDTSRLRKLKLGIKYDDPIYPGLKKLKLNGKDLSHPPPELFTLLDLELLDLSPERRSSIYFRLPYVPSAISNLVNLKVLIVDTNELQEIPREVTLLHNLERLCISNNRICGLPDGFESLKKLRSLHAANNEFAQLPSSICKLKDLEFLDLSDNKLTALPTSISNMTGLHTLMLVINMLKELPDSICEMKELRSLWIGSNHIRKLPSNFSKLINLDWGQSHTSSFAIGGNPLIHPPVEVCCRGVAEIENYFKRLEALGI